MSASRRPASELAVVTRAKQLCAYVMEATQKSPKAFRFTFVTRMQNLALDAVEQLFRANEVFVKEGDAVSLELRRGYQHEASVSCKLLVYVAEMAMSQGCLTMRQYEQISKQAADVGHLIGGWMNSDRKRFLPGEPGCT